MDPAIRSWVRTNAQSPVLRSMLVLFLANVLGQGIVVCSYPLLTRLFRPSDFGILAIYSAAVSLLSVAAALRYEISIPLATEERTGMNLLALSMSVAAATTILLALTLLVLGSKIMAVIHISVLDPYLWLLPVGFFAAGLYQILTNWVLREERFVHIAISRVAQGVTQSASQLLFGLLRFGPVGLLLGDFVGQGIGDTTIGLASLRANFLGLRQVSIRGMVEAAGRYRRFPLFSSWASILNTGSLQVPPILFAVFYGPQVAGWFSLSWRAVLLPAFFVGEAVSQVYAARASRLVREDSVGLSRLFFRTALGLLCLGVVPTGFIAIFGPQVFGIIFGDAWRESGTYAQILCVSFLAQFVVGSVSRTLLILERQQWQLAWDSGRFVIVVLGLVLVADAGLSSRFAVAVYAITLLGTYLALFVLAVIALARTSGVSTQ